MAVFLKHEVVVFYHALDKYKKYDFL